MQGLLTEARRFASLNICLALPLCLSANGSNPFHPSRRPLAAILPLFLRRVQLPIPLGLNLLLMPGEHVLRRYVTDHLRDANEEDAVRLPRHKTFPHLLRGGGKVKNIFQWCLMGHDCS